MPYIKQEDRKALDIGEKYTNNAGELNYLLTRTVIDFLFRNGPPRYQDMNDAVGALEGCKLELYRKLIGPYEDIKIKENGDVYPSLEAFNGY